MAGRGNERLAMIGRRDTQTKNSPNSGNSSTLDCILPCYTFLQSTTLCYVLCLYRGITAGPCSLPVG